MNKILIGIAAVAALAFGLFTSLSNQPPEASYPLAGAVFDTPTGAQLDLGALEGKLAVVNFWATWCPPCVEEMPELDELYHNQLKAQGIEMVGIAIDSPSAVKSFLEKTSVSYPIVMAGYGGTELAKRLGNSGGGLPFTIILDKDGNVLLKKAGRVQMQTIVDALPK